MADYVHKTALILGASEVKRLNKMLTLPVICHQPGFKFQKGFGIAEAQVQLFGVGGRTAPQIVKHDLWKVESFRPEVVVLHVGGNDLSNFGPAGDPRLVGRSLLHLCEILVSSLNVDKVLISELTPRYPPYCDRDYPPDYNDKVQAANEFLKSEVASRPSVFFWEHRVSWNYYLVDPEDGVHFNRASSKRWYQSLKRALLTALRDRL